MGMTFRAVKIESSNDTLQSQVKAPSQVAPSQSAESSRTESSQSAESIYCNSCDDGESAESNERRV